MPETSHRAHSIQAVDATRRSPALVTGERNWARGPAAVRRPPGATDGMRIKSRLLDSLTDAERHTLLGASSARFVSPNQVIVHVGDPAQSLFLLVSGQARHFVIGEGGQQVSFQWLTPGDIFGGA